MKNMPSDIGPTESVGGDPEIPLADRVKGYPKLAGQIQLRPEVAIFRRFGSLNAENLLYFQAELALLERDLHEQQIEDSRSGNPRKSKYALSWFQLSTSEDRSDESQLRLVYKIRETLKQYNEALIQQSQILAYPEPDRWDLTYMQNFLQNDNAMGVSFSGPDALFWGSVQERKRHSRDLITLCPRQKEDPFSSWVVENAITKLFCCLRFKKPSRKHGVVGYHDAKVLKITYWITSILASLIPILSIIVLYRIHSMPKRLGVIAAFNVLISVCLVAFTSAKRVEVFAVAATFAAVQVVFVTADNKS